MNRYAIIFLKVLRNAYQIVFKKDTLTLDYVEDPDEISKIIYEKLIDNQPCMVARFGSTELATIINYIGVRKKAGVINYITGKGGPWWWENKMITQLKDWSGFFPPTIDNIEKFCELMINEMGSVDILGSWLLQERYFDEELVKARKVRLIFLDPFWSITPWTKALEGKKVLVIHPFATLIEEQYKLNRKNLFKNKDILPTFDLITIEAVQSLGGDNNGFENWFAALEFMKNQINKVEFDICLIGCGAYGFLLASHVKNIGKKAVHWGGALQLLFGIKGKRWEDPNYASSLRNLNKNINYLSLMNDSWIRPESKRTEHSQSVENGCYW